MNSLKLKKSSFPSNYSSFITDLKKRIRSAQIKASVSVNKELIQLYWDIGRRIYYQQQKKGWGGSIIELLSRDLQKEFPGVEGFSTRNIWRMRSFYLAYIQPSGGVSLEAILPQAVAEIPWGHNVLLLEKVKDLNKRLWFVKETIKHGWSRAVLWHQIDTGVYERQTHKVKATNFSTTLPASHSDLVLETIKDSYNFDFLSLGSAKKERDLEQNLVENIKKFLLELGVGFSFVGSQYHLSVGDQDFYIDLLFYHLQLRCFVVIDLKIKEFKPEHAGKMNFYLSVIDDRLRHSSDNPTIGLILCKYKNKLVAEYALQNMGKPIGISSYRITESLPKKLKGQLPSIKAIETELSPLKKRRSVKSNPPVQFVGGGRPRPS